MIAKLFGTILICFSLVVISNGQTLTIAVLDSNDVCGDTVIAYVDNPQPGYFYSWNQRPSTCTGGSVIPYAIGDTIQITNTGKFFCTGIGPSGVPEFSNDIQVRVLPFLNNTQSLASPYPPGPVACTSSLLMCIPEELYDSLVTLIRWYKDGVEIIGADSSTYLANVNGTYKYSIKSHCSQTFSDTVQLITQPVVPVVTTLNTSPVCSGSIVNAVVNNVQPGATYIWEANVSGGAWVTVGNGTTINYSVPSGSSLSLRSVMNAPCYVPSNILSFQIDDILPVISPSNQVALCAGSSVTLTSTAGLPASYQWLFNNNPLSGSILPSLTTTSIGNYALVATASCGTVTSDTVIVFADPLTSPSITATGSTNICAGSSVTLSAVTGPGYTYQWKKYGNLIAGATSSTHSATSAGIYRALITSGNGCLKSSNYITVSILPLPNATISASGPTTFCAGDSVELNAATGTGYTYQWRKGLVVIPGASAPDYTATTTGNYRVRVTGPNGCYKSSNIIAVNVPCRVGNEGGLLSTGNILSVYPNPSSGIFKVEVPENYKNPYYVSVTDLLGKSLIEETSQNYQLVINLTTFQEGIYLIKINDGEKSDVMKLVKYD